MSQIFATPFTLAESHAESAELTIDFRGSLQTQTGLEVLPGFGPFIIHQRDTTEAQQ